MLRCCDVCPVATSLLHFNILVWFYFLVFVCSTSYSSATVEMAYGVYAQLDPTPFCRIQNCGGTFMYLSLFHTQSLALTHAAAACLSPQSLFYVFRAPSEHLASAAQRRCQSHTNMQTPIGTRRHTHKIRLCLPRPKNGDDPSVNTKILFNQLLVILYESLIWCVCNMYALYIYGGWCLCLCSPPQSKSGAFSDVFQYKGYRELAI